MPQSIFGHLIGNCLQATPYGNVVEHSILKDSTFKGSTHFSDLKSPGKSAAITDLIVRPLGFKFFLSGYLVITYLNISSSGVS